MAMEMASSIQEAANAEKSREWVLGNSFIARKSPRLPSWILEPCRIAAAGRGEHKENSLQHQHDFHPDCGGIDFDDVSTFHDGAI
jgi:hypothetical protein